MATSRSRWTIATAVRLFTLKCLLAAGAASALFAGRADTPAFASDNFHPTGALTLSSHAAGASADLTLTTNTPSGDLLGAGSAMTPASATISPGPNIIAGGLGDIIGNVAANTTIAFGNAPCNTPLALTFPLLNATVDNSPGNLIYPSLPSETGPSGALAPFRPDVNSVSPGIGAAGPGSAVSPSNGLPAHVDLYPAYLNTIFDPDGAGPASPLAPLARYSGSIIVATQVVVVQVLVFSPGAFAAFTPPDPSSDLADPALGYITTILLNDPTAPPPSVPGPISDLCSPFSTASTVFGETNANPCAGNTLPPCNAESVINNPTPAAKSGRIRYQNPLVAGTYLYMGLSTSARDADGDGIENSLDTCPYDSTPSFDSRASDPADDPDNDRIPGRDDPLLPGEQLLAGSGCDPTPLTNTGSGDHDADGWVNTADNCPIVPNATQAESEDGQPLTTSAPRGGSTSDSIGDACDTNAARADGHFHHSLSAIPKCIANADGDNDGWCLVSGGGLPADPNDGNAAATPETYSALIQMFPVAHSGSANLEAETGLDCLDAEDDDFDGTANDGCLAVGPNPESGGQCTNGIDDDVDGTVNDGCPAVGPAESGDQCKNAIDDDLDGAPNDGCTAAVANSEFQAGAGCNDAIDNDGDLIVNDGCPVDREPVQVCGDSIDNDADGLVDLVDQDCRPVGLPTNPPCAELGCPLDWDGDGYTNEAELNIGTDAIDRCGVQAPSEDWPSDLTTGGVPNSTNRVVVTDLTSFVAPTRRLDKSPGHAAYSPRWDLAPGPGIFSHWININDLTSLIAGYSGHPPMFNGQKAFNGPACTQHPVYKD